MRTRLKCNYHENTFKNRPKEVSRMKKVKTIAILSLATVVAVGGVIAVILLKKPSVIGTSVTVGGGLSFQEVLKIGKLATLNFHYRDVLEITERKELKLFGLNLDPRKKYLIVAYEGAIQLGIDCEKIRFTEGADTADGKKKLEITLPPVQLLSSEIYPDSYEVMIDEGVWSKDGIRVTTYIEKVGKQQLERNARIMQGPLVQDAYAQAKLQLETMFSAFSDVRDLYEIVWVEAQADGSAAQPTNTAKG
jgi:hypothetical protein